MSSLSTPRSQRRHLAPATDHCVTDMSSKINKYESIYNLSQTDLSLSETMHFYTEKRFSFYEQVDAHALCWICHINVTLWTLVQSQSL